MKFNRQNSDRVVALVAFSGGKELVFNDTSMCVAEFVYSILQKENIQLITPNHDAAVYKAVSLVENFRAILSEMEQRGFNESVIDDFRGFAFVSCADYVSMTDGMDVPQELPMTAGAVSKYILRMKRNQSESLCWDVWRKLTTISDPVERSTLIEEGRTLYEEEMKLDDILERK